MWSLNWTCTLTVSHCQVNAGPWLDGVYIQKHIVLKPLSKARNLGCIWKELAMTFIPRHRAPGIKKSSVVRSIPRGNKNSFCHPVCVITWTLELAIHLLKVTWVVDSGRMPTYYCFYYKYSFLYILFWWRWFELHTHKIWPCLGDTCLKQNSAASDFR